MNGFFERSPSRSANWNSGWPPWANRSCRALIPRELGADLAACGLDLVEDLNGSESAARYDRGGAHRLGQSTFSHIALARVKERA